MVSAVILVSEVHDQNLTESISAISVITNTGLWKWKGPVYFLGKTVQLFD